MNPMKHDSAKTFFYNMVGTDVIPPYHHRGRQELRLRVKIWDMILVKLK